jgi:hypothetical protein
MRRGVGERVSGKKYSRQLAVPKVATYRILTQLNLAVSRRLPLVPPGLLKAEKRGPRGSNPQPSRSLVDPLIKGQLASHLSLPFVLRRADCSANFLKEFFSEIVPPCVCLFPKSRINSCFLRDSRIWSGYESTPPGKA